jgi:hypothetical protein
MAVFTPQKSAQQSHCSASGNEKATVARAVANWNLLGIVRGHRRRDGGRRSDVLLPQFTINRPESATKINEKINVSEAIERRLKRGICTTRLCGVRGIERKPRTWAP